MKKTIILLFMALMAFSVNVNAQTKQLSNRYGMKLTDNGDGTYSLLNGKKYLPFANVDVDTIPGVYELYTYVPNRLQSRDYKGVRTEDIIFKKTATYECKLTIDYADASFTSPTPFMIYIHGGGWQRGDNNSSKSLSQYLAKQYGVTGVRVEYVMSGVEGSTVEMSIQDILDAYKYICDNAKKLNIDASRFGFLGTSAGAHLAGIAAMRTAGAKVLVGYSGIYDLTKAAICMKAKAEKMPDRVRYFFDKDEAKLRKASAYYNIPKKNIPAALLVCGTADATIECSQSVDFAAALKKAGGEVKLLKYTNYDHNLSSKTSDKMEEIFFHSVDFIASHLGATKTTATASKKPVADKKPAAPVAATVASQKPGVPAVLPLGITSECPDSSGIHKDNHFCHLTSVYDEELKKDVYNFIIHANIDDDRGKSNITDRQRNEVKTDNKSPLSMRALEGETLTMRWKFRLPVGFKTTKKFSHIHQLKGIDNKQGTARVGQPLITFTCYTKGNGKGQELRLRWSDRNNNDESITLDKTDLAPFLGTWVEVEEKATFAAKGSYSVVIRNVKTGSVMFEYKNDNLDMWRTGASSLRPKWGIYRYLGEGHSMASELRDEEIRFADFEIIK